MYSLKAIDLCSTKNSPKTSYTFILWIAKPANTAMPKYTARVKLSGSTASQEYRLLVRKVNREDGKKERKIKRNGRKGRKTLYPLKTNSLCGEN